MKKKLNNLIKRVKRAISYKYFWEEIAIFIAIIFINFTNFSLNFYFGMYFLSLFLIGISAFSFKNKLKISNRKG